MRNLRWRIGQLFPRTFWAVNSPVLSRSGNEMVLGEPRFVIWKMWLGRSYNVTRFPAGAEAGQL